MPKKAAYRNPLELGVAEQLDAGGVEFSYESIKLPVHYEFVSNYTPDFIPKHGPIILESKGFFHNSVEDRKKLVLVKKQHPGLDIRLVFQKASTPIRKGSKTTYGDWATKEGFLWSDKGIVPAAWIREMKPTYRESDHRMKAASARSVSFMKQLGLTPQAKVVLAHLGRNSSITPLEANSNYQISRLASCIGELRAAGYQVRTDIRKDQTGHKYGRYSLPGAKH